MNIKKSNNKIYLITINDNSYTFKIHFIKKKMIIYIISHLANAVFTRNESQLSKQHEESTIAKSI